MAQFTVMFPGKGTKLNRFSVVRTVKRIVRARCTVSFIQGSSESAGIIIDRPISVELQREIAAALGGELKQDKVGFVPQRRVKLTRVR